MNRVRPEDRFWDKVRRAGPDECWPWTGAVKDGKWPYGIIGPPGGGTPIRAHRLSWEMAFGAVPKGLWVLHRCDNPRCVNPRHLFLGTAKDNTHDAIKKGRLKTKGQPRGERNSKAVLTADQVRELRAIYASGAHSVAALARRFGIHPTSAWSIIRREHWTHI